MYCPRQKLHSRGAEQHHFSPACRPICTREASRGSARGARRHGSEFGGIPATRLRNGGGAGRRESQWSPSPNRGPNAVAKVRAGRASFRPNRSTTGYLQRHSIGDIRIYIGNVDLGRSGSGGSLLIATQRRHRKPEAFNGRGGDLHFRPADACSFA